MAFFDTREFIRFSADKLAKNNLADTPQLTVDVYCLQPGQQQKPHAHVGQAKFYYVIDGQGSFMLGGQARRLGAGGLAFAAAGEEHGVRNDSTANLVLLVAIAPSPNLTGV